MVNKSTEVRGSRAIRKERERVLYSILETAGKSVRTLFVCPSNEYFDVSGIREKEIQERK